MGDTDAKQRALEWLANGHTGISSKSLCFEFLGIDYGDICHPLDPADLNRCLEFLEKVPEARPCVDSLAKTHRGWDKAAKVWDEITQCFKSEIGIGWPDRSKSAPITYDMMKKAGL